MTDRKKLELLLLAVILGAFVLLSDPTRAQLPDRIQNPNTAGAGINKSLSQQIGAGRGDRMTPNSSAFIIDRDPFRAIRRGRQLFQRKFLRSQGQGPLSQDAAGNLDSNLAIGAGLADSCASCHGRPRGSAGFGGDVATRPDSRDAPHLFGLASRRCSPTRSPPTCVRCAGAPSPKRTREAMTSPAPCAARASTTAHSR